MSFTFFDFVLFAGISQGIFLAISIRLLANRNKKANNILAITIGFAVLMLLGRILIFKLTGRWVQWLAVFVDTTIFLFGPFIYLYIKRLLFDEDKNTRLYHHFILATAHLIYVIIIISFSIYEKKALLDYPLLNLTGFIVETLGLLSLGTYTIKGYLIIRKHKNESKYEISYDLKVRQFLKTIIVVLALFTLLWCISYISGSFFRVTIPFLNYISLWVSIPVFIYVVGFFNLKQPEIFKIPSLPTSKKEKPRLKPEEIKQLQKRLHYFMFEEELFKVPELSLKSLAEKLNTSSNNVSWLLNQVHQQSFYDYINMLRIKEVIKSIDAGLHIKQTLLAIAYDAGFNSKSTFNKAFKNETSLTPSAYIKNKQVA